ncbi:hypothetical protein PoB_000636200 [Plakobranchus ocellatus]|uniref:Uncharacterized protein n=1 Tax=Plakobranchus ocellatus TaxID=259542 RepID=A0AAV3YBP8_9GAST|nr:hypothetical protein PoB_000636200 [Plakobranchus ocellatus]
MSSEGNTNDAGEILDELGSSFMEAPEGAEANESLDINEIGSSEPVTEEDKNVEDAGNEVEDPQDGFIDEEIQEAEAQEIEEEAEVEAIVLDADADTQIQEGDTEIVAAEEEKEASVTEDETPKKSDSEKNAEESKESVAKKKEDQEEEDDAEENEETDKKMAEKFDPNQMPQVNVATLAVRRWQVKVYPLRPSDFMSGAISRVFKQAKESLLYLYTAGNNGKFSNGKAELYMSTISQAAKVMNNLIKMDFFHPETNVKIIRKNDMGVVIEKAYMRFDTKMTSLLCQPSSSVRRVGSKRERVIGSVFLKNLPDGATKDMLRVMFPFAAEINFNPEKFKDSTARLVLSNRNGVIPCLKAFSKVELGGNILELRPLEKRKRADDIPKKVSDGEKQKEEEKSSESTKDVSKSPAKKDDAKSSSEKETTKKGPSGDSSDQAQQSQKDQRKPSTTVKKPDVKRPGGNSEASQPRLSRSARKQQNRFVNQRWQDRMTGLNNRRGNLRSPGNHMAGRGSSFAGSRSRFGPGDGGMSGRSPGRMGVSGISRPEPVNTEMTKEMMQLQAQLSVAIKNQMSMLSQTQLALEQAKRDAAANTAAAAAAAMGVGNTGMGFSRGMDVSQGDQYSRLADQPRRNQAESGNRQRSENRNRARDRRNSHGSGRGSNRGNRDSRSSNFAGKRSLARTNFDSDAYDDVPYPKRSNLGFGSSTQGRSWAEETEDLDLFGGRSRLSAGAYGGAAADYGDDQGYGGAYNSR